MIFNKNNRLKDFLEISKDKYSISALAIINLENSEIMDDFSAKLAKKYKSATNTLYPKYLLDSLHLRSDPRLLFPWAKSIFTMAIPFSAAPNLKSAIPEAKGDALGGLIAGYATKVDYHIFGKDILEKLAQDVAGFAKDMQYEGCEDFNFKACVDTFPVAEKALAEYAEVGVLGDNSLLLTHDSGSGCFIAEIFTNISFPDIKAQKIKSLCGSCSSCSSACSTGALRGGVFEYNLCRSCLTMEKRGALSPHERKLLGGWIFGCDDCVTCCPGSQLPLPFSVDLEWLLFSSSSEVKQAISSSPMEYAGVTLLRRNSLAVLENYHSKAADCLIQKVAQTSGSVLLKQSAEEILKK